MERVSTHLSEVWYKLVRTRPIAENDLSTPLNRCLNTFDITLLGVGHMVGAGIYVLTGTVTRYVAGPAIVVSFLLAAVVSFLSALCFAEFASRVPRAGSTYTYTYITMGEFWAFLVGWTMVLDQLVGVASVARSWSGYVDALSHGAIRNATVGTATDSEHAPWTAHLDFLAAGAIILFTLLQAIGVRGSTNINSLFSLVNVGVMIFVSCYGLAFADASNWEDFTPFGVPGVLSGATSCFYAYVGLDSMSVAAEEAKDPGYSVPRATFYAMAIVTIGYLMVSTALTLMVPYDKVDVNASLPYAFAYNGVEWAQYLISVAALAGMSSVLYGHLYTVSRYLYNMAADGLVFRCFSRIHQRTQVPTVAVFFLGAVAAILALLMEIQRLVEFLAMGALVGYSMVAMAVLMLRYRPTLLNPDGTTMTDCIGGELKQCCHFLDPFIARLPYASVPAGAIYVYAAFAFLLSYLIAHTEGRPGVAGVFLLLVFATVIFLCYLTLLAFEQTEPRSFAVPFCPTVPLLSIGFNMILLSFIRPGTWVRFLFWMLTGLMIYFCYGMRHSTADESWKKHPLTAQEQQPQWYGPGQGPEAGPPSAPPPPLEPASDQPARTATPSPYRPGPVPLPERDPQPYERAGEPHPRATEPYRQLQEPRPPAPSLDRDESLGLEYDSIPWSSPSVGGTLPREGGSEASGSGPPRPELRRQSLEDADSLPSLSHDQMYRLH